jgi:prefoldin subunit 5
VQNKRMAKQEFKKAMEIFISQIKEIDKKINDLKEKGWLKKVEKLSKRKEDLQKKLSECDAFLKKLS